MKEKILALFLAATMLIAPFSRVEGVFAADTYPESTHPYVNNTDEKKYYTVDRYDAVMPVLSVTFSDDTALEEDKDFLMIYNDKDELIGTYTGTQLGGETIYVRGNTEKLCFRLVSDSENTDYGYAVTQVLAPNDKAFYLLGQPSSLTLAEGQTATFSVDAYSPDKIYYQWQRKAAGTQAQWEDMDNETEPALSMTASTSTSAYSYRCYVSTSISTTSGSETTTDEYSDYTNEVTLTSFPATRITDDASKASVSEDVQVQNGKVSFWFVPAETSDITYYSYSINAVGVDNWTVTNAQGEDILLTNGECRLTSGNTYFISAPYTAGTAPVKVTVTKLAFTSSPTQKIMYRYNLQNNIDIRGRIGNNEISTTLDNMGFSTYIRIPGTIGQTSEDSGEYTIQPFSANGQANTQGVLSVTPKVDFSEDGSYAIVTYSVKNTSADPVRFSLAVASTLDLEGDDSFKLSALAPSGFGIESEELGLSGYLGFDGADTTWFGDPDNRLDYLFKDYTALEATEDTDFGIAASWDCTLPAEGSKDFCYRFAIGQTGSVTIPSYLSSSINKCGDSLLWYVDGSTLVIRGSGDMQDYSETLPAPWDTYASSIKSVQVGDSVTSLGDYAFFNLTNLEKAVLPASLTEIGANCFGTDEIADELVTSELKLPEVCASNPSFAYEYAVTHNLKRQTAETVNGDEEHVHDYTVLIETVAPTCQEDGYSDYKCLYCEETIRKDVIEMGEAYHHYDESNPDSVYIQKDPTCTETGTKVYVCDLCGDVIREEVLAILPHTYEMEVVREATCKETGLRQYTCTECGFSYTETIPVTEHIFTVTSHKDATCTTKGSETLTCSICGEIKTNEIPIFGHDYVRSKVIAPTCTSAGCTEYTCTRCKNTIQRDVKAALGHTTKIINKTKFYTGDSYCTRCKKVISKGKAVKVSIKTKTAKLSATSYTYDKKAKKPGVTINGLKKNTDFTVSYKNNKNVGIATVTITGKGNYNGKKTLTFSIVPKGTTVSKLTKARKGFKVTWKKQTTQTTGYEIQYSTNKSFKKGNKTRTISKAKTTSVSISKQSSKKTYYVRIRTYKTVKVNGKTKKLYSSWSKAKNVKTK